MWSKYEDVNAKFTLHSIWRMLQEKKKEKDTEEIGSASSDESSPTSIKPQQQQMTTVWFAHCVLQVNTFSLFLIKQIR